VRIFPFMRDPNKYSRAIAKWSSNDRGVAFARLVRLVRIMPVTRCLSVGRSDDEYEFIRVQRWWSNTQMVQGGDPSISGCVQQIEAEYEQACIPVRMCAGGVRTCVCVCVDLARVMAPPCARSAAAAWFSCKSRLRNIQSTTSDVSQTCKSLSHALAFIRRTDRSSTARDTARDRWMENHSSRSFWIGCYREERRMRRASWIVRGSISLCFCVLSSASLDEISRSRKLQTAKSAETHVSTISCSRLLYPLGLKRLSRHFKMRRFQRREAQRSHINAFDDDIRNAPRFLEAYLEAKHSMRNTNAHQHAP